jgi:hypothetical protein
LFFLDALSACIGTHSGTCRVHVRPDHRRGSLLPASLAGPGGLLDLFTKPRVKPVILNATTGEVVSS